MTKPAMIRQIFAELRNTLGPETPAYELLECASLIAEANDNPLNGGGAFCLMAKLRCVNSRLIR